MFGRFRVLRRMRRSRHDHAKNLPAVMCRGNWSALLAIRAVARSTRAEFTVAYPATFCQSSKRVLRLGRARLGAGRFCLRSFRTGKTTPLVGSHPGCAHGRRLSRASSLALPERRRGASNCRGKGGEISTRSSQKVVTKGNQVLAASRRMQLRPSCSQNPVFMRVPAGRLPAHYYLRNLLLLALDPTIRVWLCNHFSSVPMRKLPAS